MTETTEDRMSLNDLAESLNGWEELAVQKTFGFSIADFENQGTLGIRALAFVEFKREAETDASSTAKLRGNKDAAAHKAAMDLTLGELIARYPEMNEDDPADPMAGIKDDAPGKA